MLTYYGEFPTIIIDRVKKTKRLERIVGQIFRESIREWLRAILVSVPERGGFPVLTGAAKSTLAPLGRFLRVAVPVTPQPNQKDRRKLGEASQFFKIVDDRSNPGSYIFTFEWETDLEHYIINEFLGLIRFAPWHTLKAGDAAFNRSLEERLQRRLPEVFDDLGL